MTIADEWPKVSQKAFDLIEEFLMCSQLDTSKSRENARLYLNAREELERYISDLEKNKGE